MNVLLTVHVDSGSACAAQQSAAWRRVAQLLERPRFRDFVLLRSSSNPFDRWQTTLNAVAERLRCGSDESATSSASARDEIPAPPDLLDNDGSPAVDSKPTSPLLQKRRSSAPRKPTNLRRSTTMPLMASPQRAAAVAIDETSSGEESSVGGSSNQESTANNAAEAEFCSTKPRDNKNFSSNKTEIDYSDDDDTDDNENDDDDDDDGGSDDDESSDNYERSDDDDDARDSKTVPRLVAEIRRQAHVRASDSTCHSSYNKQCDGPTICPFVAPSIADISLRSSPPLRVPPLTLNLSPARSADEPYRPRSDSPRLPLPPMARVAVVEYLGNPAVAHEFTRALEQIFEQHEMSVSVSAGKPLDKRDMWSPRARSLSLNHLPLDAWTKRNGSQHNCAETTSACKKL